MFFPVSIMLIAIIFWTWDLPVFKNVKSDQPLPFHAEVKPGYNKLFTISPIDPQAPIQTQINCSSTQKGCMHPVSESGFHLSASRYLRVKIGAGL